MALAHLLVCLTVAGAPASKSQINYTLRVDPSDLATFAVHMRVRGAPAEFTIAAAAHSEYDDKYWRYLEAMKVENGTVERLDSVRWRVRAPAGVAVITYRVRPPVASGPRGAWRAFLTKDGGLIGGPHSFLYVIGLEQSYASVELDLPAGWRAATGLEALSDRRFMARDIAGLLDSPIIVGPALNPRRFTVDGVPHDVVYWGTTEGAAFDTTAFVGGIERLVRATVALWDSIPYGRYTFIFQDGTQQGGLEHRNSVTLGAPSEELARDPLTTIRETAHEFFHTWNLMTIRPAAYRDVDYRVQPPVPELWFSEGLTIFYADLLARRAGLPVTYATRAEHLAMLIARYLSNSGYSSHSAEEISRHEYNSQPGALGDFDGSPHLVGELIGALLDIIVRDATSGARSMDDVMRRLLRSPSAPRFRGQDVEAVVREVCSCSVSDVFDSYVRGSTPIDFDRYLARLGLRAVVSRAPATTDDGKPAVDLRLRAFQDTPVDTLRLLFWDPGAAWVRAGLHTNDRLLAIDGEPVRSWPDVTARLRRLQVGDPLRFEIERAGKPLTLTVRASGYEAITVRLEQVPGATERQARLRAAWQAGR